MNTIEVYPIYYVNDAAENNIVSAIVHKTKSTSLMPRLNQAATNKKKFFRLFLLTIVIFGSFACGTLIQAFASTHITTNHLLQTQTPLIDSLSDHQKIHVHQGDTLWDIALKYAKENENISSYVDKLYNLNHLDNVNLQVGQALFLP